MHKTMTKLADEVKAFWMATVILSLFTSWPNYFTASKSAANHASAAEKIVAWHLLERTPTSPFCRTAQQAALQVNWQFSCTKEEVG